VDVYWAASPHATAGTLNPGGCSGVDAAYTGTSGDSLDDSLMQLQYLGSISLTADADPLLQIQTFTLFPQHRYGMPVIYRVFRCIDTDNTGSPINDLSAEPEAPDMEY